MKYLFTMALMVWCLSDLSAQSYDQELSLGFRVGYAETDYSEVRRRDLPDGYNMQNYGYGLGIFMQVRVNHIYFQPEILYTRVSTVIAGPLGNQPTVHADLSLNFSSFQVPLAIGYRKVFNNSSIRIGVGTYFNFLFGTNGEFTLAPGGVTELSNDFFEGFNTVTIGSRFNIGLDVNSLVFDLAYQRSFSRLSEEIDFLGGSFSELGKERTWVLAVGYKFIRRTIR